MAWFATWAVRSPVVEERESKAGRGLRSRGADSAWARRLSLRGRRGWRGVGVPATEGTAITGERSESVRVCRDPLNTVRLLHRGLFINAFLRSISCCIHVFEPSLSSFSQSSGRSVNMGSVCSFVTCLASLRFFCASCCAHCLFSWLRSTSARCSSSFNSMTRRSWVAMAVKMVVSVGAMGVTRASGIMAEASLVGEVDGRVGLLVSGTCTGKGREKRFDRGMGPAASVAKDMVLLWLWQLDRPPSDSEEWRDEVGERWSVKAAAVLMLMGVMRLKRFDVLR